jgi:hypothetical protein
MMHIVTVTVLEVTICIMHIFLGSTTLCGEAISNFNLMSPDKEVLPFLLFRSLSKCGRTHVPRLGIGADHAAQFWMVSIAPAFLTRRPVVPTGVQMSTVLLVPRILFALMENVAVRLVGAIST